MASKFNKGDSVFFVFRGGESELDSQLHPRMYKTVKQFESKYPSHYIEGAELVEYVPANGSIRIPSCNVNSIRHGRWVKAKNPQWPAYSHDQCSLCGWWNTRNAMCYDGGHKPGHSLNFCPNCGAKMDVDN